MGKLGSLGLIAFACCASLAVAMGYGGATMGMGSMGMGSMGMGYNPYMMSGMMGGMKGGAMMYPMPMPYYGGAAGGVRPVGQGGLMQFFFMLIFLMFFLELFRGFGNGNGNGKDGY